MLTLREATKAPRSRSPLSPTEVTESATERPFLILSALLYSLRCGFCIVCDFAHARPIMLQHSTSNGHFYRYITVWDQDYHARPTLGAQRAPCLSVYILRTVRNFWSRGDPRATRKRKPAHLKFKGHMRWRYGYVYRSP